MRSSARTARFSPHARAAVNRGTSGGPSGVVGCARLAGIREFGFELVEPFAVRGEELACEPMREHEVACAVWDLLGAVLAARAVLRAARHARGLRPLHHAVSD